MAVNAPLWRDANHDAIQVGGVVSQVTKTLSANNTTASVDLFTVTGSMTVTALYAVVTTVLSSNITGAYWRVNDGSTAFDITNSGTGTTLSAFGPGSLMVKKGLTAVAATPLNVTLQPQFSEPATAGIPYFSPFLMAGGNFAATKLQFVYSTTNTPASGAIQFFVVWMPVSRNASLVAA